jgi:hypothetical protein
MRLYEIITEAKTGTQTSLHRMSAPTVSTIDSSAPWIKKQRNLAYTRAVDFNQLETDKEKFDYIKNLSAKSPSTVLRVLPPNVLGNNLHIQKYDPVSGEITLIQNTNGGETIVYQGNVNQFKYKGRTRTSSNSGKNYEFIPNGVKEVSRELKTIRAGRPPKTKPFSKPSTLTKLPW